MKNFIIDDKITKARISNAVLFRLARRAEKNDCDLSEILAQGLNEFRTVRINLRQVRSLTGEESEDLKELYIKAESFLKRIKAVAEPEHA